MIPKKLLPCKITKSFVIDEKDEDVLIIKNMDIDEANEFREVLMKRYNDYNLLKTYVIILGITVTALTLKLWLL